MNTQNKKQVLSLSEMIVFALLGTIMFCSKIVMELLPNIHLLATLTIVYTITFRKKALIPIYIYVILNGLFAGFNLWWVPYTYIWTILWAVIMLLPKNMPQKLKLIIYPLISLLHGMLFGVLYAPAQALMFGLNFKQTVAWVMAGIGFDVIHGVGNLLLGSLILPLSKVLQKAIKIRKGI